MEEHRDGQGGARSRPDTAAPGNLGGRSLRPAARNTLGSRPAPLFIGRVTSDGAGSNGISAIAEEELRLLGLARERRFLLETKIPMFAGDDRA